jgi:hypothetical protein
MASEGLKVPSFSNAPHWIELAATGLFVSIKPKQNANSKKANNKENPYTGTA